MEKQTTSTEAYPNPLSLPFLNLDERDQLPGLRACYFVLQDNQILYIGRANNLRKRWISHHILRNYILPGSTKIAWYEAKPNWSLEKMEKSLIEFYKPAINVPCKPGDTVRLVINIPESLHRNLKKKAADEGISMSEMLRQDLIQKYGAIAT